MNESITERDIKVYLAELSSTAPEDWYFVSRARHGMEVVLRQLPAGEVITQAFTCITAVNPILSAGHIPVYCDISPDTFSIDARQLGARVTAETRAVIMQHTLGMTADVAGVRAAAPGVFVLEDSAHCVGHIAKVDEMPIADVSVHSFGAEKILDTRFGAAVWVNPRMADAALREKIVAAIQALPRMGTLTRVRAWLYPPLNGVLNRLPSFLSGMMRTTLLATGMFRSPIVPSEQRGRNADRPEKLSQSVMEDILAAFKDLPRTTAHRKELAGAYMYGAAGSSWDVPAGMTNELVCVRFPLLAPSAAVADEFFRTMRTRGYAIGKWYRPLLFPGPSSYEAYHYQMGSCPIAEDVADRIINLPTNQNVTMETAKEIIDALNS